MMTKLADVTYNPAFSYAWDWGALRMFVSGPHHVDECSSELVFYKNGDVYIKSGKDASSVYAIAFGSKRLVDIESKEGYDFAYQTIEKGLKQAYQDAHELVCDLFKDKVDKAGKPYIHHLEYVADKQPTYIGACLGYLHDVIEDTDLSRLDLEERLGLWVDGLSFDLCYLTKPKDVPSYEAYIANIQEGASTFALQVKLADLEHNMDLTRLFQVTDKDLARQKKYQRAHARLLKELKRRTCFLTETDEI